jgi:hypothetical protein
LTVIPLPTVRGRESRVTPASTEVEEMVEKDEERVTMQGEVAKTRA